ncbi:MAG: hypothetical protein R2834_15420 [Rhodothermales bacterium]
MLKMKYGTVAEPDRVHNVRNHCATIMEPYLSMASLTIKSIPDTLLEQLRRLAEQERRSLNQQAILLLEQALSEGRASFRERYEAFVRNHGPSPLEDADFDGLRSPDRGRPSPFGEETGDGH